MSSETFFRKSSADMGGRARPTTRQQVVFPQIVEWWNQLAAGQITARAKNHHGAGIGRLADSRLFDCGRCFSLGHIYFLTIPGSKRLTHRGKHALSQY